MTQYGGRQHWAIGGALDSISGVTDTLPAAATLGDVRDVGNIRYRLCYNAGNSQVNPGQTMSAVPIALTNASSTLYSMTITTATDTGNHLAACVVHNKTATTGTYFWGVTRGRLSSGLCCTTASASTGNLLAIADTGFVQLIATSTVLTRPIALCLASMTTGSTSPTRTGDAIVYIE